MLFMVEYKMRPNLDAGDSKRLMDIFMTRGPGPGEVAHYVKIDGTGGVTLNEVDDIKQAYETCLAYAEFIEFNVTPALKIEDAVGPMMAQVAANS